MPFRVVGINTGVTSGYLTGSPQHPREYAGNDCSSDEYLQVNSCGIFDKLAESPRTFRPEGRRDYQILFVESVGVRMQTPGGEIMLSAGDMILLAPHVCHDYRYLQGCTAIWVHFTGRGVRALLERFEMEPFVKYSITDTGPFLMLAEKIIREYRFRHVGFESISSAYLVQMLTLAKRRIDASAGDRPLGPPDLSPAFEDMQIDFARNRALSDYAKMCGICPMSLS
ncbi:MAG: AraC family ligand binding domain-containing protein [Clostridia bacterium]|nr:AraC family ligand binding domain-containing protein [Clostridia bacterium]